MTTLIARLQKLIRSRAFIIAVVIVDILVLLAAYYMMHRPPPTDPSGSSGAGAVGEPHDSVVTTSASARLQGPIFLAATKTGALTRVFRGSCQRGYGGPARVWVAARFRAPLRQVSVPQLKEALGVAYEGTDIAIAGATRSCALRGFISSDGGRSWKVLVSPPNNMWYLMLDTTSTSLYGPPNRVYSVACTATAVSALGSGQGLAICPTFGVSMVTPPSGHQTQSNSVFPVVDPSAATSDGAKGVLALDTSPSCQTQVVRLRSESAKPEGLACASHSAAGLALANVGGRIFAQIGYHLEYSVDGGHHFQEYPSA